MHVALTLILTSCSCLFFQRPHTEGGGAEGTGGASGEEPVSGGPGIRSRRNRRGAGRSSGGQQALLYPCWEQLDHPKNSKHDEVHVGSCQIIMKVASIMYPRRELLLQIIMREASIMVLLCYVSAQYCILYYTVYSIYQGSDIQMLNVHCTVLYHVPGIATPCYLCT